MVPSPLDHSSGEDRILVEHAKQDPTAYTALYRKYAKSVYNYIWYRVRHDETVAEDLTQEVFVRAYQHLSRFEWRGYSYLTYLYRIAHNTLVNYFQSSRHRHEVPQPLETLDVPYDIAPVLEDRLALQDLWRAVQSLPEDQKSAVLLYYRQDMPVSEIAHVLGTSVNAAKLLLSRARKRLKAYVGLDDMARWQDARKRNTRPRFRRNAVPTSAGTPSRILPRRRRA